MTFPNVTLKINVETWFRRQIPYLRLTQGWSVLGLRELGACGRQCASTVDLEYLLPSKHRWDNLRDWN